MVSLLGSRFSRFNRALFYDKRMGEEVNGDDIGEEFKGYVFKISGGQDHQGFAMIQGVFANQRVKMLMKPCHKCFKPKRDGYKKKKSVRGCIVGPDIKMLHLVVVVKGEADIPGLTDTEVPKRLGPKRARKVGRLFAIDREAFEKNPKGYYQAITGAVIRRVSSTKGEKTYYKAPKIQRLITATRMRRKKNLRKNKLNRQKLAVQ